MTELLVLSVQVLALALLLRALEATLLRRSPVAVRELLWFAVLLRFFLPVEWGSATWLGGGVALGSAFGSAFAPVSDSVTAASVDWSAWINALRWSGAFALVVVGGARFLRARSRLVRNAKAPDAAWQIAARHAAARLRLRRVPRLRVSATSLAPCVIGIARSVVFVPASAVAGSAAEREHVLLHEFSHAARRDGLRAALVVVVQVLFWFHPVVWFAARRLALLREIGADRRAAARATGGARAYGRTLLRWSSAPPASFAIVGWKQRSSLRARIEHLVQRSPSPRPARRALAFAASVTLAVLSQAALAGRAAPDATSDRVDPAASATGPDFSFPADSRDLPGCLQRRYLVFQAIAAERERASR